MDMFTPSARELVLRDYQLGALDSARANIRAGSRRQILCAPTGAGKTIIALGLMKAAEEKGARSAFITDRSALIDQTSQAMDMYGIDHGVMQATHWRCRPAALVQLVSAQTLGRRLGKGGYVDYHLGDLKFVLIDECFVSGTMIATPNGNVKIEDIWTGDLVVTADGAAPVRSVFRGFTRILCIVRLSNGQSITCTEDHPFFTEAGWQHAGKMGVGTRLYSEQALRALWLSDPAVSMGKMALLGDGGKLRQAAFLRQVLRSESRKPDALGRSEGARGGDASPPWPQAAYTGRQWPRNDGIAGGVAVGAGGWVEGRVFREDAAQAGRRVSASLQDRSGAAAHEDRGGARRIEPWRQIEEGAGCEEGRALAELRVESVSIEERRSLVPVYNLRVGGHPSYFAGGVLVHNCHTLYKSTLDWLAALPSSVSVIGLTATPFTKGLGKHFSAVVNVATTDELIKSGMLTKPILYAAVEADISGVAVKSTGEWDDKGLEIEGVKIVGDVVVEYTKRTLEHFGGPVKTIAFSSTVAHGEEICRAFSEVGLNFQNISYMDDEDERRAKITEFRKPDSAIMGLVSCDALAKGFDVPDVKVCILCRPLRKSLTTHIQQIGRVMRPAEGKDKALVICHTGNALRFLNDTVDFWANGVDDLDEGAEKDKAARSITEKERKELICSACSAVLTPGVPCCPACGKERPPKPSDVRVVNGVTQKLDLTIGAQSGRNFDFANHPILSNPLRAYASFAAWATERKHGDEIAGRRWAAGLYKGAYGMWPPRGYEKIPLDPSLSTFEVESFCRREMARYAKSRQNA